MCDASAGMNRNEARQLARSLMLSPFAADSCFPCFPIAVFDPRFRVIYYQIKNTRINRNAIMRIPKLTQSLVRHSGPIGSCQHLLQLSWFGVVWCCLVLFGVIWCSLVLFGPKIYFCHL